MIEVKEAKKKIFSSVENLGTMSLPIDVSNGFVCSSEIISPYDHPFFDHSAVDGYAIHLSHKTDLGQAFVLVGEVSAGKVFSKDLKANETVRIFTGAAVPDSANTVIMQEYAIRENDRVSFQSDKVKLDNHIRKKGEEIKQADTAFRAGDVLNPNTIAFLASLGVESVDVYKKPRLTSIITGDELLPREKMLKPGHIYESNGLMLSILLDQMKIKNSYLHCKDDRNIIRETIRKRLEENDVLLLSGGVSVGDYDFTSQCIQDNGFDIVLHWVNQKPGKPLLFARKGKKYIFGLPGNPRAALLCFYQYVYPFLRQLSGHQTNSLPVFYMPAQDDYSRKDDGKTFFINVHIKNNRVQILQKQQSHMLQSFILSNALVELSPEQIHIKKGDLLKTYLLPYV